ncbi:MAG: DUF4389 domain-containing protein [Longimicrobiales bacterium]
MNATLTGYPATLEIDYPNRDLDRLTTFLRPFAIIPIAIVLGLVSGPALHSSDPEIVVEAGGIVFAATVLMLLFRRKYPRWWFDWNLALTRFGLRVVSYGMLLTDEYPSTDEDQAVHLEIAYPDAAQLNRWLPLVKWILAIPHLVVLALLCVLGAFGVAWAWLTILFTGRYPRDVFDYVVGLMRWWVRVASYACLLTTDRYPPFTMRA